jgi:diguanylate cyclase (GGDEF)-like protein
MMAIGFVTTIVLLSVCAWVIGDIGRRDYARAARAAENVIATIDADITRNFELYDLSLQGVVEGLNLSKIWQVSPAIRQQFLFDRAATAKYLGSIFVLDRDGNLILDSRTQQPPPENRADSEYFQAARDNTDTLMYLSRPWSTAAGDHLIAISRRINDANGSFRGVVVGTIRLSYFYGLFDHVKLRAGDILSLVRTDGTVVMRAPFDFRDIGRDVSTSPVFQHMTGDSAGSFDQAASSDGVNRLFVYRHIGQSPLIVNYGQALDQVYAGWWQQAPRLGVIIILACAINIALIIFLARALKRGSIAEHSLAIAAMTDSLTGLCNRRRFDEIYEMRWQAAQAANMPLAILMIDVDRFKEYNDHFGHQTGDEALIAIAHCIQQGTQRSGDIAARYGGEEFIVLLTDTHAEAAIAAGEKIRLLVQEHHVGQQSRPECTPTISLGIASVVPQPGRQSKDLIGAADAALYEAKKNGRNRTEPAPIFRLVSPASVQAAA